MTFQPSKTLAASKMQAVHLTTASTTVVAAGNTVPFYALSGTSGHGVTVASGVISLPAGEWTANFAVQATTVTRFDAEIYLNGVSTSGDWPTISCYGATTNASDASTASISVLGPATIELRVLQTVTLTSDCDVMIIGAIV